MAFNAGKYKSEWAKWYAAWSTGDETATHKDGQYMNRWAEATKASYYISAHMLGVGTIVLGVLIIAVMF